MVAPPAAAPAAGGGGATGGAAPAPAAAAPAAPAAPAAEVEVKGIHVPKHVFDERGKQLKAATKLAEENAAAKAALEAQHNTVTQQLSTLQSQLAFARAGVSDDEHIEAVAAAYAKLPAEGKPASAVEYWQAILAGTTAAPRSLLGFMAAPAAAAPAAAAAAAAPGTAAPPRPALPAVSASPAPAGPTITVEQVRAAQEAFRVSPSPENKKQMKDLTELLKQQSAKKP